MEHNFFVLGFIFIIFGGIMEGSFSLPLKFTPRWAWENTWGAGSLLALIFIPWPLAFLTVPHLLAVYTAAPVSSILLALFFGAGWGIGGIFFGLGLAALGLSLGLTIIMGLIAIGGSIIPLLMQHPEQITQPAGLVLISGILIMIIGLSITSKAGKLKDIELTAIMESEEKNDSSRVSFKVGFLFCIIAGLLSALVNFGLIFGTDIIKEAVSHGADSSTASNAVWALVFTANYIVNIIYCFYLARKNKTFSNFTSEGSEKYWAWALFMGLLWPGGIVIYGMGAVKIGELGAFLGFPVMLICSILAGNILGAIGGEWKNITSKPKRIMITGVIVLIIAVVILGYSSKLIT